MWSLIVVVLLPNITNSPHKYRLLFTNKKKKCVPERNAKSLLFNFHSFIIMIIMLYIISVVDFFFVGRMNFFFCTTTKKNFVLYINFESINRSIGEMWFYNRFMVAVVCVYCMCWFIHSFIYSFTLIGVYDPCF